MDLVPRWYYTPDTRQRQAPGTSVLVRVLHRPRSRIQRERRVRLSLTGSSLLNDLRISPDGKHAVVTHMLARFHLPTTQLDRGWINTNAKTLIDLGRMEVLNTVLLDTVDRGAAYPWGAAWSADGRQLVVARAGTHEISVTDFPGLLEKLTRLAPAPQPSASLLWPTRGGAGALRCAQ
jgi:hypothetical protein